MNDMPDLFLLECACTGLLAVSADGTATSAAIRKLSEEIPKKKLTGKLTK